MNSNRMEIMVQFFEEGTAEWSATVALENKSFVCGFCNVTVSSIRGYLLRSKTNGNQIGGLYICPNCRGAIFVSPDGTRYPSPALGNPVKHVPPDLEALYEEARRCSSQNCYTGAVLLCRKMLMNIAVEQGEREGLQFIQYVNFLADKGFVPPNGKHWVDHIRKKGNEATHEIAVMNQQDAQDLISFIEMLLRFIYEFPNMIPTP
jgi:Domain of unknown function (DUF4145)